MKCMAGHYISIGTLADGFTGTDGKLGSMRVMRCKRNAIATVKIAHPMESGLCATHLGMLVGYGRLYLIPPDENYVLELDMIDLPSITRL